MNWLTLVFSLFTALSSRRNEGAKVRWVCSSDTEIMEEIRGPEEICPNERRGYYSHFIAFIYQISRIFFSLDEVTGSLCVAALHSFRVSVSFHTEHFPLCRGLILLPSLPFWELQPPTFCWTRRRDGETVLTGTSSGTTSGWRSTQNSSSLWARGRRSILQTQWPSTTGGSRCVLTVQPWESPNGFPSSKNNSSFCFWDYQNRTCPL